MTHIYIHAWVCAHKLYVMVKEVLKRPSSRGHMSG